jgi:hypothetical protein
MTDPEDSGRNRQQYQYEYGGGVRPAVATAMIGMFGHGYSPLVMKPVDCS